MTECLQDTNPLDPSDDKEDEPDSTPEDDGSGHPLQSLDPNEMAGPLGWGNSTTERFVAPGQWMDYTIYFENKATASAAAGRANTSKCASKGCRRRMSEGSSPPAFWPSGPAMFVSKRKVIIGGM